MKLEPKDTLTMEALIDGNPTQGLSTFMLVAVDNEGHRKCLIFGCKPNHAESVRKVFQRLTSLKVPSNPPDIELEKSPLQSAPGQLDALGQQKVEPQDRVVDYGHLGQARLKK